MKIKITNKKTAQVCYYDNVNLIESTSHYLKIFLSHCMPFDIPYKSCKIRIINDNEEWSVLCE
jgi:hypothetical protein